MENITKWYFFFLFCGHNIQLLYTLHMNKYRRKKLKIKRIQNLNEEKKTQNGQRK